MTDPAVGFNLVDLSRTPTGVWISQQRIVEGWNDPRLFAKWGVTRWRDWRTHRCSRGRIWSKPGPWGGAPQHLRVPRLSRPRQ